MRRFWAFWSKRQLQGLVNGFQIRHWLNSKRYPPPTFPFFAPKAPMPIRRRPAFIVYTGSGNGPKSDTFFNTSTPLAQALIPWQSASIYNQETMNGKNGNPHKHWPIQRKNGAGNRIRTDDLRITCFLFFDLSWKERKMACHYMYIIFLQESI